jgi:3-isopropylmalate/(R)-2-methylmalate dehydratase small subunit
MKMTKGKVWKFGANIDTDAILPAAYLNLTEPKSLSEHCFEITHPKFCQNSKKGDFILADTNFGCGSSREHAPVAIKAKGIQCVIASNFARIFFRNAFNIGLPVLECSEAVSAIEEGQEIMVDMQKGEITDTSDNKVYKCEPLPENMLAILNDGGLIQHINANK